MLSAILQQTLIISTFVIGMMMIIEYINIQTRGIWSSKLQKYPWMQIIIGSLMGIIPGCLGTYTIVSLYIHRVIAFPALIATFIATSGDEAFLMFSMIPKTAIQLTIILFVTAVISGFLVQLLVKNKYVGLKNEVVLPLHEQSVDCCYYHPRLILSNLKNISFTRALLLTGTIFVLIVMISGIFDGSHHLNNLMGGIEIGHDGDFGHENCGHDHHEHHEGEADWIRYSLITIFGIILFIVLTAKEHFLDEHLWKHIIKKHFLKIFLWTFGVILAITIINQYVNVEHWITNNVWLVLLIAILIGIIPESGPHFVFVILFAQGALPISILLASSIVQDGHGSLPLLAESPKGFFAAKIVNIIIGLIVGGIGILAGF